MSMDDEMQRDEMSGSVPDELTAAVHLATGIGARLRAELPRDVRDRHVAVAAAAAARATAQAAATGGDRIVRRPRRSLMRSTTRPGGDGLRARRPAVLTGGLTVAVAAVALVGGLLSPSEDLPVFTLGGSGAPMAASPDAAMTLETGDARSSMMIWRPITYVFELADGVQVGAGSGPAWRFDPPADPAGRAALLTAYFGLPTAGTSPWDDQALEAQGEDGASLWVGRSGEWYYSGPFDASTVWRCTGIEPRAIEPDAPTVAPDAPAPDAPTSDADGQVMPDAPQPDVLPAPAEDCVPPVPPAGVPNAEEARTLALDVLRDLGIDGVRILDTWADEWGAHVYGVIEVEGVQGRAGAPFSVGFGGGGRVTFASATFAQAVRIGAYPTVDAATAVARLTAMFDWSPNGGGEVGILPYPAIDDAFVTEPDLGMVPETLTVRLVSVAVESSFVWMEDGTMLLVPHYVFTDSEGGSWYVVAVEDRYITG